MESALIRRSMTFALLAALFGVGLGILLTTSGGVAADRDASAVVSTFYLFVAQDRFVAIVTALVLAAAWWFANKSEVNLPRSTLGAIRHPALPLVLVATTFGLACVARFVVHHGYNMALDEVMPGFQAQIFLSGNVLAPLTDTQFEAARYLQPFFTYLNPEHGLWGSYYRPVHAGLLTLFTMVSAADLLNPVMAAITVWALISVTRRVFPNEPHFPVLAAALLMTSPQFLLTAGTGFSFSAHLAFNMVWLALFLNKRFATHCVAAVVGFLAVGLHQVHVHPLFAAPFLAALLFGAYGHRSALVPYALAYGLALPIWMMWPELAVLVQTGDTSILPTSVMQIDYIQNYFAYTDKMKPAEDGKGPMFGIVNILRFLLWISPALLPLIWISSARVRHIGLTPALAGASFLLTLVASHILMPNQMQSWGSRYYHPVLGCLVIFALAGLAQLQGRDRSRMTAATATLTIVAAVVFLPWRAVQIEAKVGPRASVQSQLEAIDADVVLVPSNGLWFGYDFIRNAPSMENRPIIAPDVDGIAIPFLTQKPTVTLSRDDMFGMGLPVGTFLEPGH